MSQFNRNANMHNNAEPREINHSNRTLRWLTSPMISNTARGFSSSLFGPNRENPNNMVQTNDFGANPNEPIRAMETNNISPLSVSRFFGSNLLLNQRVGTSCFIPTESNDDNIAPSIVPPHCNNCHYRNDNNFQNLSLDLTLGVRNYNGEGSCSNDSSAWHMPRKRTNEFAFSEFAVGESSNAGTQAQAAAAGIPKRHAGIENISVSSPPSCICITCPQHGNPGPHHQRRTSGNNSRLTAAPSGSYMLVPDPNRNNINGVVHSNNNNNDGGFLRNGSSSHPPPPSASSSSFVVPAFQQLSSIAHSWIQRLNVHHEYLRMLSLENQRGVAPLPPYLSDTDKLMQEIRNVIHHLRIGGSIRLEELLILDYSIVLNLLESANDDLDEDEADWDGMQYEDLVNMEDQIGYVDVGLTEDQILVHIGQETFQSNADNDEANQNDICGICQDDYVDGEHIGRLDCRHGYHLECIQHWLMIKNTCPICKQIALTIVGDDEDEEDEE